MNIAAGIVLVLCILGIALFFKILIWGVGGIIRGLMLFVGLVLRGIAVGLVRLFFTVQGLVRRLR